MELESSQQRPSWRILFTGPEHPEWCATFLYTESDFIMTLKSPQQVRDVAAALPQITEEEFRRRYFAIDAESYGCPLTEEDFGYTWDWFQGVRDFWLRAATEDRYVLFTADQ